MAEILKLVAVLSPAVLIGVIGLFCGSRFVDRKLRYGHETDPSRPIILQIDERKVKTKQIA
jgi:hypothetical protein